MSVNQPRQIVAKPDLPPDGPGGVSPDLTDHKDQVIYSLAASVTEVATQRDIAYDDIRWLLRQRGEPEHPRHDVPPVDEGRGRGCLTCLRYAQIVDRLPNDPRRQPS